MPKNIRISDELFSRLEKHARGFDSPASVIERVLNEYEGIPEAEISGGHKTSQDSYKKDTTKYLFNGTEFGKGRLVLAVIREYVKKYPDTSFAGLLTKFPKSLQGSIGVFNKRDLVLEKYADKGHKRHFVKPNEVIQLSDCDIVVSTEWGIENIQNLIPHAESLGFAIETSGQ